MKYLKIIGELVVGTDNLTQHDLGRLKQHNYDIIINRITEEYFDIEKNKWKPISNIDIGDYED